MRKAWEPAGQTNMAFVVEVAKCFRLPIRLVMFPSMNGRKRSSHRHRNRGRA